MKLHIQDQEVTALERLAHRVLFMRLGRAISLIADLETTTNPKTTFNVGVVEGGTIPTAIAEQAKLYLDIRSNGKKELG
ncbi:peptidase dimerization domain-containing protein [Alkalicoccobacillus plakortidis]|nr:peptidase dimerization domain-containing protein [Alkalicoccobacillus plakortidis]